MQTSNKLQETKLNEDKAETIKELSDKHLHDPNHITTDEEIKNAVVEFSSFDSDISDELTVVDNETLFPPLPGEPTVGSEEETDSDDTDDLPNPYTVVK